MSPQENQMVTPSVSLAIDQRGRLFTAADLAILPTHLPSGDVDYELDKGRLIVLVPSGCLHGAVHAGLISAISAHAEEAGHGEGYGRVGLVLSINPDTVFAPDVAFITTAKLPARESPEGFLETVPDLVIEIRDRNDTTAELNGKVATYLAAGVRVVWIADPVAKTIVAHQSGSQPHISEESDTIALDEIIPGLRLSSREVFNS
jgi:Uma2 family endonuclease